MAVSANDNLGGCVIQLRLYLIDIVQKNYRGVSGLQALSWPARATHGMFWGGGGVVHSPPINRGEHLFNMKVKVD